MEKLYLWCWTLDWSSSASSQDHWRLHDSQEILTLSLRFWQDLSNSLGVQSSTTQMSNGQKHKHKHPFECTSAKFATFILNVFTYFVNRNLFIVYWNCLTCNLLLCSVWTTKNCTVSVRGIMKHVSFVVLLWMCMSVAFILIATKAHLTLWGKNFLLTQSTEINRNDIPSVISYHFCQSQCLLLLFLIKCFSHSSFKIPKFPQKLWNFWEKKCWQHC